MIDTLAKLNDIINKVRSTNYKMVNTVNLAYLTFFWIAGSSLLKRDLTQRPVIEEVVLLGWLGFLGAIWGIDKFQHGKERDTDWELNRIRANAPAPVVPTKTVTETAGPSKTTTAPAPEDKG